MFVKLSNVGNPDFGQNPNEPVWGTECFTQEVKTLREARDACMNYIEINDLGGGNWTGGQVTEDGKDIAYISYNGRVWVKKPMFGDPIGAKEIMLNV